MGNFSFFQKLAVSASAAISIMALSATHASAFTYTFNSTSTSSNTPATGASAKVNFDFVDLGGNQVRLDLGFSNTTGLLSTGTFGSGATASKLTGVAFDLFSDVSVASYSLNGKLDTWLTNVAFQPFSNSVGNFTVAFADNNNFEGGNANGALAAGETSQATLVLNSSKSAIDLREQFRSAFESKSLDIAARFQQVNAGAGSDKLLGGTVDGPPPPKDIPEPATLAGLSILAAYLKGRQQQSSEEVVLAES